MSNNNYYNEYKALCIKHGLSLKDAAAIMDVTIDAVKNYARHKESSSYRPLSLRSLRYFKMRLSAKLNNKNRKKKEGI